MGPCALFKAPSRLAWRFLASTLGPTKRALKSLMALIETSNHLVNFARLFWAALGHLPSAFGSVHACTQEHVSMYASACKHVRMQACKHVNMHACQRVNT